MVTNCEVVEFAYANLVQKCNQELQKQWEVKFVHNYRESDRVANILTNVALQCNRGLRVLEDPPSKLICIFKEDVVSFSWPRKVPIVNSLGCFFSWVFSLPLNKKEIYY